MPENMDLAVNGTRVVVQAHIGRNEADEYAQNQNTFENKNKSGKDKHGKKKSKTVRQAHLERIIEEFRKFVPSWKDTLELEVENSTRVASDKRGLGLSEPDIASLAEGYAQRVEKAARKSLALPEALPPDAMYQPRQGIVTFLETGWPAPYIKAGVLTRPDLRRLDPAADQALRNWLRDNCLPHHLLMPTRSEVAKVDVQGVDSEQLLHARRIVNASNRHKSLSK